MVITAKIHPSSSQQKIIINDNIYHIYVHKIPEKGKANQAVIALLADYFKTNKSSINIVSGHVARIKNIEIIQ